jgi:hypothetical protein
MAWALGSLSSTPADAATPATPATRRFALVIGNNQSLDADMPALRFADDDAIRYREFFDLLGARVVTLTVLDRDTQRRFPELAGNMDPPTRTNVIRHFKAINREMKAVVRRGDRTELYFVFSGHGGVTENQTGYIHLLDGSFHRSDFYKHIIEPADSTYTHVIIDACNAYYFVHRRGGDREDDRKDDRVKMDTIPWIENFIERNQMDRYPGIGAILSTSGPGESHEWSRYGAGVFSHEIRSALLGAADVNNDGRVEYGEVAAFVTAANLNVTHPEARLAVSITPPARNNNHPVVDLSRGRLRYVVIGKPESMKGFVVSAMGVRWADFHKTAEQPLYLALHPEQDYYMVRGDGKEVRLPQNSGWQIDTSRLKYRDPSSDRRGHVADAFHRYLFTTPFGINFAKGYLASMGYPELNFDTPHLFARVEPDTLNVALALGIRLSPALLSFSGLSLGVNLEGQLWLGDRWYLAARLGWSQSSHDLDRDHADVHTAFAQAGIGLGLLRVWRLSLRPEILAGYLLVYEDFETSHDRQDNMGALISARLVAEIALGSNLFATVTPGLDSHLLHVDGRIQFEPTPCVDVQFGMAW